MQKDTVSSHFAAAAVARLTAAQRQRVLRTAGIAPELLAQPRARLPAPAFRAYRAGKLGALLSLLGIVVWGVAVTTMFSDLNKTTSAFDSVLRFAQVFGAIAFPLGLLLTLWNLKSVWTAKRRRPAKVWSVVLVFSAFILLWIAFAFHLISWGVNY